MIAPCPTSPAMDKPAEQKVCLNDRSAGRGPDGDAPEIVDSLIEQTFALGASDLHLLPTQEEMQVFWRIDGVLHLAGTLPKEISPNVVTRLKVLAELLTYENQTPQEGRLKAEAADRPVRVSTLPTIFGEKVVARVLPSGAEQLGRLVDLQMPSQVESVLARSLAQTSGLILVVGPAGSGKTTTAYAVIREIQARASGARSIATLEDPVEVVLPGVAQSQAAPHAGFDLHTGLRALVRQDPEVILIGEIRDAQTARIAYQAALTGQLVVTTFHASDAAAAITRLIDMGVPPYVVRGATRAVVAQRLLRRLCECTQAGEPVGCQACRGTGYRGRRPIAEAADLSGAPLEEIREGCDRKQLHHSLVERGMQELGSQAEELVRSNVTSQLEMERVLGC